MSHRILYLISVILLINLNFVQSQTLDWAKSFGGSGYDASTSIISDDIGNVYTLGFFENTVDFDPGEAEDIRTSNGGSDVYIQKLDSDGNLIWVKTFGGTGSEIGYSLALDNAGNILIVGSFTGTADFDFGSGTDLVESNGILDAFLVKLNSDGDFLLKRTFGGTASDEPNAIVVDQNNLIYIVGEFQNTVDFDAGEMVQNVSAIGGTDLFVLKLDANADFLWVKTIGGNGEDLEAQQGITVAEEIVLDSYTNLYITGAYTRDTDFDPGPDIFELNSTGAYHMYVLKLDKDGNLIWVKSVGDNDSVIGRDIDLDGSGNIYTTGALRGTADFDPGNENLNLSTNGKDDVFIQKLDSNGNLVWAKTIGGLEHDSSRSLITDSMNNVYVLGSFRGTVDFDPGDDVSNLTSENAYAMFILQLDNTGEFGWVQTLGKTSFGTNLTINPSDNFYLTGRFANTLTFDFGNGINNLTSNGDIDNFVLKLSLNTLDLRDYDFSNNISYFPNPTDGKLTIISDQDFDISIFDLNGRKIKQSKKNKKRFVLSLENLDSGIYILRGENRNELFSKRIVISN